ncbi:uncharacterized protein LOC130829604 isoform X2 [Hippopotamus amphibius kiboko]|uniref:uncharacterized protein LOC130829604 isoform X2 n=1 Tax=Hippopotamus amphibius kiboko TaxID=575201 RepID=UPI0025943964|nr:uncharacterized protein LOC130829604 isoform X2 [Hippopotamus amphibius kiboko]
MMEEEEEEGAEEQQRFSYRQRLKAAVHYTVGCLCEEVASDKEMQFSKQTIAAISEVTFRQCENFAKDLEMFAREGTQAHKTLISGLPSGMTCRRAREQCQSACRMPPPLCPLLLLLLLPSGATTALPLEGGPAGHNSGEVAEIKKNSLLTFLEWWYEWASQARAVPFVGGDTREVSKRQEGLPLQQSTRRDKMPCKNFFWKTFSSCK